jgi:hypothetical protein
MKRRAQFLYAGNGGKPVYVHGYLTDEHQSGSTTTLLFEVTGSEPEPRPKPGVYRADDLPGGWMTLMPESDQTPPQPTESDQALLQIARAAGFPMKEQT